MKHHKIISLSATILALCACDQEQIANFEVDKYIEKKSDAPISGVEQTLLDSAKAAESNGDYVKTKQYYQQLIDRSPKNSDYAYGLAESMRRSGDLESSIQVYTQIINVSPDYVEAYEGKGLAQLAKADMDNASQTFSEVIKRDPNRWRTLNAVGVLFAAKKMYSEGMQYFKAALDKSPNNPTVLNNMGLVSALDKDLFTAINNLQKAASQANSNEQLARIELNTALVYAVNKDLVKAEELAQKHLSGAQLSNNLGLYAHMAKDDNLAKTYLNMALTESKVYYEKAWDNLQNVQNKEVTATTPTPQPFQSPEAIQPQQKVAPVGVPKKSSGRKSK